MAVAADPNWYRAAKKADPLSQGDLIASCPVLMPPTAAHFVEKKDTVDLDVAVYDVVVVTQSCDLDQGKINQVLVCPVHSLDQFGEWHANFKEPGPREEMRRGYLARYHMLAASKVGGLERPISVVDFTSVHALPLQFLKDLLAEADQRLQLISPYTEHLSQAFAHFFMRVALPEEIAKFEK